MGIRQILDVVLRRRRDDKGDAVEDAGGRRAKSVARDLAKLRRDNERKRPHRRNDFRHDESTSGGCGGG